MHATHPEPAPIEAAGAVQAAAPAKSGTPVVPGALVLHASGLSLSRGRRRLIDRESFSLAPGQWMALTGPNGAGKSSLLRALAGLLDWDDRPQFQLGSQPLERLSTPPLLRLLFQGHAAGWKDALSVRENLRWQVSMDSEDSRKGRTDPSAHPLLEAALQESGMAAQADVPFGVLSAGQRRRVSLARLRISLRSLDQPEGSLLWLLDEPATALDQEGQRLLGATLAALCARGGMAIVATHGVIPGAPQASALHLGGEGYGRGEGRKVERNLPREVGAGKASGPVSPAEQAC